MPDLPYGGHRRRFQRLHRQQEALFLRSEAARFDQRRRPTSRSVFLSLAAVATRAKFATREFDLPEGATVYGDKAYNEYFTEDILDEACDIDLSPIRKKNSTRPDSAPVRYLRATAPQAHPWRRFSQIDWMIPQSIHAITAEGFELKVFLFVLAFSFAGLF